MATVSYRPDIEERVRRLLAMAGDPNANVNEAQPMAHVAAKLIKKHGLECGVGAGELRQKLRDANDRLALCNQRVQEEIAKAQRGGVLAQASIDTDPHLLAGFGLGGVAIGGMLVALAFVMFPPKAAVAPLPGQPSSAPPGAKPGALAPPSQAPGFVLGASARVVTKDGQSGVLRAAPGTGSNQVVLLPVGTVVRVLDGTLLNGVMWYRVQADAGIGWVHTSLLVPT